MGLRSGLGGSASASFKAGTAAVKAEIKTTMIHLRRFGSECTYLPPDV
jgi:hypothetical protein